MIGRGAGEGPASIWPPIWEEEKPIRSLAVCQLLSVLFVDRIDAALQRPGVPDLVVLDALQRPGAPDFSGRWRQGGARHSSISHYGPPHRDNEYARECSKHHLSPRRSSFR